MNLEHSLSRKSKIFPFLISPWRKSLMLIRYSSSFSCFQKQGCHNRSEYMNETRKLRNLQEHLEQVAREQDLVAHGRIWIVGYTVPCNEGQQFLDHKATNKHIK